MKNTKYKVNSWVVTALVIVAVILVNLIVSAVNNKIPLKIDLTKDNIYEISNETKVAISQLDKTVDAYILSTEADTSTLVKEYINRYKAITDKVKFNYIDIYKNQALLMKYQQNGVNISQGDIIFECGERYKAVSLSSIKSEVATLGDEALYQFDLESKMTNGIIYVAGLTQEDKIYFLEGHGEQNSQGFETVISDLNHTSEYISIISNEIPDDANIIATVLPNADFSEEECRKIEAFLDKGGKMIVVYNPGLSSCPRFESYLSEWGITPTHQLVCENDTQKMVQSPLIFRPEMTDHEINSNLNNMKLNVLYYLSIGFNITNDNSQRAQVTSLAKTSNNSVGKANISSTTPDFEDGDTKGPIDVCVISEKNAEGNKKSAILAIGSMAITDYTDEKANVEFMRNSLNYLTENTTNLQITPKIITEGLFTQPSVFTRVILYYVLVWIIPIGLLLAGIVIWLKRRYL